MRRVGTNLALTSLLIALNFACDRLAAAWRFHRVHHSDAQVDVTTA